MIKAMHSFFIISPFGTPTCSIDAESIVYCSVDFCEKTFEQIKKNKSKNWYFISVGFINDIVRMNINNVRMSY